MAVLADYLSTLRTFAETGVTCELLWPWLCCGQSQLILWVLGVVDEQDDASGCTGATLILLGAGLGLSHVYASRAEPDVSLVVGVATSRMRSEASYAMRDAVAVNVGDTLASEALSSRRRGLAGVIRIAWAFALILGGRPALTYMRFLEQEWQEKAGVQRMTKSRNLGVGFLAQEGEE